MDCGEIFEVKVGKIIFFRGKDFGFFDMVFFLGLGLCVFLCERS